MTNKTAAFWKISSSFWLLNHKSDATKHSQQLERAQQTFAYAISFDDCEKWKIVSGAAFFKYFRSQLLAALDYLATLVFLLLSTPFLSGSLFLVTNIHSFANTNRLCVLISLFGVPVSRLTRQLHVKKPPERLESESRESGLSRPGVNHHRESAVCSRYFYFVTICLSSRCSRVLIIGPHGVSWSS